MNRQYQSCVVRMYVRYISYQCYHIIEWYLISLNSMNWSYDMLWYSQNNWKQIQNQSLKQGPFTANEDEIIINKLLEALTEYGKLPRGIWVLISHGLNRDLNSVYEHWRQILSKKKCFDFSYEGSICWINWFADNCLFFNSWRWVIYCDIFFLFDIFFLLDITFLLITINWFFTILWLIL